jgi:predicted histone-like DNA-binding protein
MAEINYSVAAMKNPMKQSEPPKYYAKMQANGVVDMDDLAEEISYATTLTDGDILNVLRALIKQMKRHLKGGKIVKLEKFGNFQFQICSNGTDTEKEFTPACITKVNIQFRPGALLKEVQNLDTLTFKKVPKKSETSGTSEEEDDSSEDQTENPLG